MLLYTCQACVRGEHDYCAGKNPPPPGMFGGSECDCDGNCGARAKPDPQIEAIAYVICPEKITSPYPDYGLPPNAPCGCKCPVMVPAEVMHFHCPRGHYFIATPQDVHDPKEGD